MAERRYCDIYDFWDAMEPRLDRRAAYETVGNLAALYDAFLAAGVQEERRTRTAYCDVPLPEWVRRGLAQEVPTIIDPAAVMSGDVYQGALETLKAYVVTARRGHGRHARWARRYSADEIHWTRFEYVWFYRLPNHAGGPTYGWNLYRHGPSRVGHADDVDVFEHVSRELGTWRRYAGGPTTIARSYSVVTKALRDGEAGRFYPSKYIRIPNSRQSADRDRTY